MSKHPARIGTTKRLTCAVGSFPESTAPSKQPDRVRGQNWQKWHSNSWSNLMTCSLVSLVHFLSRVVLHSAPLFGTATWQVYEAMRWAILLPILAGLIWSNVWQFWFCYFQTSKDSILLAWQEGEIRKACLALIGSTSQPLQTVALIASASDCKPTVIFCCGCVWKYAENRIPVYIRIPSISFNILAIS